MLIPKQEIIRDKEHLEFLRSLECVVSGSKSCVVSAHIRIGTYCGTGLKPSDKYALPLCHYQHHLQHQHGERSFWLPYGGYENAIKLAEFLYKHTGEREICLQAIRKFRSLSFATTKSS